MEFDLVVEIPAGSRNKYEMDHALGQIRLDRTLSTATRYPTDYGFLPNTLGEDGDPLDALVLLDEPTFPGCLIRVRPIGVLWARDEHGTDAKVLCVSASDNRHDRVRDIADLSEHLLEEIGHFFDVYKDLEPGKDSVVSGWQDASAAETVVRDARDRHAATAGGGTTRQS
jgi:inorganic pyrophosphatase